MAQGYLPAAPVLGVDLAYQVLSGELASRFPDTLVSGSMLEIALSYR